MDWQHRAGIRILPTAFAVANGDTTHSEYRLPRFAGSKSQPRVRQSAIGW